MRGLFAAVVTPVDVNGRLDLEVLDRLVAFLMERGVDGLCVGGATGEYPHFECEDRKAVVRRTAARLGSKGTLLVGIGAPSINATVDLGKTAFDAGSAAALLPMPMFFRYAQPDLQAYASNIAGRLAAPCLLYDLPDFTNGLEPDTVLALLESEPFIVGIKDSSGRQPRLGRLAAVRGERPWTLIVGDDRLLLEGLHAGWNGGISGVAGFCPELLVAIYQSGARGAWGDAARLQGLLDELIGRIAVFPTPWGVKIGLAARGIDTGPLPLPCTPERRRQVEGFTEWFRGWWEMVEGDISHP
jgi:4-hydroxy-tetrahydrodipicolinate synthase